MRNYTVYKITNDINRKIYIGCHVTDDINDNYMGSGANIKKAIKKFGRENFTKEILYNFDNKEEMLNMERELVNEEFITEDSNYNIIVGGGQLTTLGRVVVMDDDGLCFTIHKEDPRYLSGKLKGVMEGKSVLQNNNGDIIIVEKNDPRYISGELFGCNKGKIIVIDADGKTLRMDINDHRYISGEFKFKLHDQFNWEGKSHSEETKLKMSIAKKGKYKKDKNSQYGTCWITKNGINKKIKKDELNEYISNNWIKGRDYSKIVVKSPSKKGMNAGEKNSQYGTKWINNGSIDKKIKKSELNTFIENGWILGRVKIKKES